MVFLMDFDLGIYRRGYYAEFKDVVKSILLLAVVFSLYMFITQQGGSFSRLTFVYFFGFAFISIYITRCSMKWFVKKRYSNARAAQNVLLITTSERAARLIAEVKLDRMPDFRFAGIVIVDKDLTGMNIYGIPVVASFHDMCEYAKKSIVDEVLVNLPQEQVQDVSEMFVTMGITVHINMDFIPLELPNKTVHTWGGMTVVSGSMRMQSPSQAFLKRSMDIIGGTVGLLATGVLTIFLAPAIFIESPGPIFFSQKRVGKNGRFFKIYKFRSMCVDAEAKKKDLIQYNKIKGNMFKIDDDPRITKVGKFIRKTSMDEFPQFWNVLKGDMSLVGTRPPTVNEYEQYELAHRRRLSIKPGLTGIWQVRGRSNVVDFEEVVKMDAEYISNWSLGLDCKLLVKTVGVLMGDRNAS